MKSRLLPPAVFLAAYLVYDSSPVTTSFDSRWSIPTALSLLREGNTDLDEYYRPEFEKDFRIEKVGNHYRAIYPVGAPLVALPFVAAIERLEGRDVLVEHARTERFVASVVVALAVAVMFVLASRRAGAAVGLAVAAVLAFGTPAWSVASRALWQHGPSMLALAVALRIATEAEREPDLIRYASLPLSISFAFRPTNAIPIAAFALFVLIHHRRRFLRFLFWALPASLALLAYHLAVYRSVLPPYYLHAASYVPTYVAPHSAADVPAALAATLVSPSRGLFVYCPALLFAVWGAAIALRGRDRLAPYLLGALALHWIALSSWRMWWGGHSYGPRMFCDVLPLAAYFLIPAFARLRARGSIGWPGVALALALAAGAFIHFRGANHFEVWKWNFVPESVDTAPRRVWDLRDIQFLRGLRPATMPP